MRAQEHFACYRDARGAVVALDKFGICVTVSLFLSQSRPYTKPPVADAAGGALFRCNVQAMVSATGFEPVTQ